MKEFFNKPSNLNRIEFWAATTIYVFAVFFLITSALNYPNSYVANEYQFRKAGIEFQYYRHYFLPQLIRYSSLYLAYLVINFLVIPRLVKKEDVFLHSFYALVVFAVIGLVYGTTATYMEVYRFREFDTIREAYTDIFRGSYLFAAWLMLLFAFYAVMKFTGIYLLSKTEDIQEKYRFVTPGGLVAFVLWMLGMFILLLARAPKEVVIVLALTIPFGIALYWYAFHRMIPKSLVRKNPFRFYLGRVFFLLLLTMLPMFLLGMLLANDADGGAVVSMFNGSFHLLITAPLAWVVFKRYTRGNQEVFALRQELGRSHASFDFLRSQINPHFLFNALNTIYGTALQEKAERTGEGVEKLGNMMRFMLQENMQEKISLNREVEYLNNYIDLQKLRTDSSPDVKIITNIQQDVSSVQIPPMLLIPFVENAFKHGISLREPSLIKVTLEVKGKTLYFDVMNTKHKRGEKDPEKEKSGIGLSNVKQRLQLQYPGRHEMVIRETAGDYFVHLTITL